MELLNQQLHIPEREVVEYKLEELVSKTPHTLGDLRARWQGVTSCSLFHHTEFYQRFRGLLCYGMCRWLDGVIHMSVCEILELIIYLYPVDSERRISVYQICISFTSQCNSAFGRKGPGPSIILSVTLLLFFLCVCVSSPFFYSIYGDIITHSGLLGEMWDLILTGMICTQWGDLIMVGLSDHVCWVM
eukprot:sb/3471255/